MRPQQQLHNRSAGIAFPQQAFLLTRLWERGFGIHAPGLVPGAIVGLRPCHWVHTFGLHIPLDLAYCDRDGRVLHLTFALPPGRIDRPVAGAWTTWEAPAGTFQGKIEVGDTLEAVSLRGETDATQGRGR